MVKCSDGHGRKNARLLHRGNLVTDPSVIEWVERGTTSAPAIWQPEGETDPKLTLNCGTCGRNCQLRESLLIKALQGLAGAGMKDGSGRVTLDLARIPR